MAEMSRRSDLIESGRRNELSDDEIAEFEREMSKLRTVLDDVRPTVKAAQERMAAMINLNLAKYPAVKGGHSVVMDQAVDQAKRGIFPPNLGQLAAFDRSLGEELDRTSKAIQEANEARMKREAESDKNASAQTELLTGMVELMTAEADSRRRDTKSSRVMSALVLIVGIATLLTTAASLFI